MSSIKIKAPYEFMESKQFKLFDFVPEFSEFRQFDDLSRFGCENIENNLINHIMLLKMVLMNVNLFF